MGTIRWSLSNQVFDIFGKDRSNMPYITLNDAQIEYDVILNAVQNDAQLAMGNPTGSNGHWSNTQTIRYTLVGLLAGGQQVYIDWHPTPDKLGSIWWQGPGDERGGEVRRGYIFSGGRRETIENMIRVQYMFGDRSAGRLNNLPTV